MFLFPKIDNNLGIKAVTHTLNSRDVRILSMECIVEAAICLEHNNSHFQSKHFFCKFTAQPWAPRMRVASPTYRWELLIEKFWGDQT